MATHMTRCGFCRRLTSGQIETGPASRGLETAPLEAPSFPQDDALLGETYCRECDRFYRQLITFGRGDGQASDWNRPAPQAQTLPQPGITAELPA